MGDNINKFDDIDQLFIESTNIKREHARKGAIPKAKKIRVRGSVEVAKDNYKNAKRIHKTQIKQLKNSIKSHKLLIRQAKTSYKLVKLADSTKKWWQFWK